MEDEYDIVKSAGFLQERALLAAILHRAIYDLKGCGGKHQEVRDANRDAVRWFNLEDVHAGSFVWVCDWLGMDPQDVLSKINRQYR